MIATFGKPQGHLILRIPQTAIANCSWADRNVGFDKSINRRKLFEIMQDGLYFNVLYNLYKVALNS